MNLARRMMGINLLGALALIAVVAAALIGFNEAENKWRSYSEIVVQERDLLQSITSEMGYGGLIHELKNYVLRGDEYYYQEAIRHDQAITRLLDEYKQIKGLNDEELEALDMLQEMADKYFEAAEVAHGYYAQNESLLPASADIHVVDAMVRVNDQPYQEAMTTLHHNAEMRTRVHGQTLEAYFTQMIVLVACFAVCGMALILGAGTYLCRRIAKDEKNKELELSHQRDAAAAANQAKSAFLASVSHEIRTPMTAILGFADLLAEPDNDEQTQQDYVQTIRSNGEHLLAILNDVLDLSKIEAGRMTSELRETQVHHLIDDISSLMRVRAQERGLSLEVEYMPGVPDRAITDALRMRQVLLNLVGNAVKFTEEGGVRIIVRCNRQSTWLSIEVVDTGVGMTPAQLDRLFQPFAQGDETMARRFGGTGLGLSLCKRFVEMLGGRLSVCSTPGEGSAFWFNLPITAEAIAEETQSLPAAEIEGQSKAEAETPIASKNPQALAPLAGRVLLAEDGRDNQRLLQHLLHKIGLEVDLVENGKDAVDHALEALAVGKPYDVILMDMQMPVMDGYRATQHLRSTGYAGTIIAVTAHAMEEDRDRCLEAGCDDYASKPIDKAALHATIAKRLNVRHAA